MADYARPSIVPGKIVGINERSSVVADRDNSGLNWMLDTSGNIRKRPGSQVLASVEDPTSDVYSQTNFTVNPSRGAFGAGVMLRRFTSGQLVESSTFSGTANNADTHQLADEEIIIAGSEHFWRLTPAVVTVVPGSTLNGWDVSFDGTDKTIQGYLNDQEVVRTIIGWGTDSSPVSLAAISFGGTTYSQIGQNAVPAGYLQLTNRVHQGDQVMLTVLVWLRVPNSFHYFPADSSMRLSQPAPQTLLGIDDTNWNSTYFNGALYFAGRKKPLLKYDGLRAFVPGTLSNLPNSSTGTGYNYRSEHIVPICEQSYAFNIVFDRGPPTADQGLALLQFGGLYQREDADIGAGVAYPTVAGATSVMRARASMPRTGSYVSTSVGFATTFVITKSDGTPHDLLPGDCIYSWNPTTATGVWRYITHVSPTSITLDASTTTVATQTWTLDSIKIYRTEYGPGPTYYLVNEIPTYLLSNYFDTVNDATLITRAPYEEPTFFPREAPTITSAVCTHQNRLIVAHDGAETPFLQNGGSPRCLDIAFTEPLSDQFAVDTGFALEDSRAREIRAMLSINDTLYIFTDRSVWYVQGSLASADSFQVHLMTEAFGAANNTSVQVVDGSIWCLTSAGQLAVISGGGFEIIPEISRLSEPSRWNTAEIVSARSLRRAQLVYDPSSRKLIAHIPWVTTERYVSATDFLGNTAVLTEVGAPTTTSLNGSFQTLNPSTSSIEDPSKGLMYVIDFDNVIENRPLVYKWDGLGAAGGLLSTSKGVFGITREPGVNCAKSRVWTLDDTIAHDHGTAFEMSFVSTWLDLEDVQHSKRPIKLELLSGTEETQNFSLSVKTELDWLNSVYVDQFTADFKSGQGYDELPYDTQEYGDPNEALKVFGLSGQRTKAIRLTLSNSDRQQMPTISGWSYELANNETNTKET